MARPHSRFLGAQLSLETGARSGKLDGHIPRDGPGAASLDTICLLKVHLKLERPGARQKALRIEGCYLRQDALRGRHSGEAFGLA